MCVGVLPETSYNMKVFRGAFLTAQLSFLELGGLFYGKVKFRLGKYIHKCSHKHEKHQGHHYICPAQYQMVFTPCYKRQKLLFIL